MGIYNFFENKCNFKNHLKDKTLKKEIPRQNTKQNLVLYSAQSEISPSSTFQLENKTMTF